MGWELRGEAAATGGRADKAPSRVKSHEGPGGPRWVRRQDRRVVLCGLPGRAVGGSLGRAHIGGGTGELACSPGDALECLSG